MLLLTTQLRVKIIGKSPHEWLKLVIHDHSYTILLFRTCFSGAKHGKVDENSHRSIAAPLLLTVCQSTVVLQSHVNTYRDVILTNCAQNVSSWVTCAFLPPLRCLPLVNYRVRFAAFLQASWKEKVIWDVDMRCLHVIYCNIANGYIGTLTSFRSPLYENFSANDAIMTACAYHGPLTRYVKLQVAHAPGMPGTFSPAADFKGNR